MNFSSHQLSDFFNSQSTIVEQKIENQPPSVYQHIKLIRSSAQNPNTTSSSPCLYLIDEIDLSRLASLSLSASDLLIINRNRLRISANTSVSPDSPIHFTPPFRISNYLLIETDADVTALFLTLRKHRQALERFNTCQSLLMNAFLKAKQSTDFIEQAAQILDNPIVVVDKSFRILAHSDIHKIKDSYWQTNIKNGFCSYEFISALNEMDSFANHKSGKSPFFMTCTIDHTEKLVAKLILGHQNIGYVAVLDSICPIDPTDLPLVDFLGKLTVEQLQKDHTLINPIELLDSNFFVELLDNTITTEAMLKERSRFIKPHIKLPFSIIVIDLTNYRRRQTASQHLRQDLYAEFPHSMIIFYDKYVIIFIPDSLTDKETTVLSQLLSSHSITATVSCLIHDYLALSGIYQDCVGTLNIIRNLNLGGSLFFNENYRLFHLFADLEKNHPLNQYCHPKILNILNYDRRENTDYFNTVKIYCETGKNAILAAEKLYIHRNTLHYRLKKLDELFDLSLDRPDTFFDILLSIKIIDYLNAKKQ